MKLFIASDHAGFELKRELVQFFSIQGYEIDDCGPYEYKETDDYPNFIMPLARKVAAMPGSLGIIIGASGQGEAMAANRIKGVRAAVYYGGSIDILKLSREHNNANVLSLGARFVAAEEAKQVAMFWLSIPFSNEDRHVRRIQKLDE